MPLVKAFAGLRPVAARAADVIAPPYDVVSEAEARALADGRPYSFLHVSRPEIDLPPGTDPYAPAVYAKAAANLSGMVGAGVLVRDPGPCLYVYRLTMGSHVQTGLVGTASVAAYDTDRIKKHELTRPVKEDDRVRQIEALNAQTGPVFLVYRSAVAIDGELARISGATPEVDVTAHDGVRHELWTIRDSATVAQLTAAFDQLDALYVADGHHRSAAAARVCAARRAANPAHTGEESYNYFLAVIFPHDQMRILDYNRLVRDLNGRQSAEFLAAVGQVFAVEPAPGAVRPARDGEFGMYLDRQWYRLVVDPARVPTSDPVGRLDVSVLQDNLLGPVLGIGDPRRDERIDFVGGIRGLGELQRRVDGGEWRVAFALHPTGMEALMAVADAGEVMPPKSTWFEPKLADGLVSHVLD
jgi:uncharacterized protein (DUF1015 family)